MLINEINNEITSLSYRQIATVNAIIRYLRVPVEYTTAGNSSLVDEKFAEEMKDQLRLHHATHESPLNKKPFEYAFKQCLIAQGHSESDLNPKPGESAYDVYGNNQRWSLKTEAGKSISPTVLRIEKLSEALWIRQADTPERCVDELQRSLSEHMQGYDRIICLRAKRLPDTFEYTLDEVPKRLLSENVAKARPDMFFKQDHGKRKGTSYGADFTDPATGDKVFRMLLDSSVEKVRVWIRTQYCINHGKWVIRKPESTTSAIHSNES